MAFDPSKPFDLLEVPQPSGFDPSKPHELLPPVEISAQDKLLNTSDVPDTLPFGGRGSTAPTIHSNSYREMTDATPVPETTPSQMLMRSALPKGAVDFIAQNSLPAMARDLIKKVAPGSKAEKAVTGVVQGTGDIVDFMTSPAGVASLGIGGLPAAAQRVAAGGIAAYMASQVPDQATELGKAVGEDDTEKASRILTGLAAQTAGIIGGALHAASPVPKPEVITEPLRDVPEQVKFDESKNIPPQEPNATNPQTVQASVGVSQRLGSSAPASSPDSPSSFLGMNSLGKNSKIFRAVVESIPGDVMGVLSGEKGSADDLLSDPSMFSDALSRNSNDSILGSVKDSARSTVTGIRAKLLSALSAGRDEEIIPTVKTSDLKPGEVVWLLSQDSLGPGTAGAIEKLGNAASRTKALAAEVGLLNNKTKSATLAGLSDVHKQIVDKANQESSVSKTNPADAKPETVAEPKVPSDYEQYQAVTAKLSDIMKQVKAAPPEEKTGLFNQFTEVQKELETIKNRNKGMPPKPPNETPPEVPAVEVKPQQNTPTVSVPTETPTPVPEAKVENAALATTGEGPGATVAGPTGIDPKAQIQALEESFRNIQGKKVPFAQKVKEAFDVGKVATTAKDALSQAIGGLKASGQYLKQRWEGADTIDDMLKSKGELSSELEKRGYRLRQLEKTVEKAVPDKAERAAISKYVDAGGDAAELQRGLAEAPAEYKKAYQDAINFTQEQKIAAENIRNYFDSRLQEAIDARVLEEGVDDYIHRIYEKDPKALKNAQAYVQSGILSKNPALARKRIFQYDWEAEKAGFKPVQDFLPRLLSYESSLSKAIAARDFVKKATDMKADDGRPVVDIKGVGIPINDPSGVREGTLIKPKYNPAKANTPGDPNYRGDYVNREYGALSRWKWIGTDAANKPIFVQGDVAIHPDFVGRMDALLKPSSLRQGAISKVTKPLLDVGSTVKSTMLDFSAFHQVQLAVHALEHKVNPLNLPQEIDFNNPEVEKLLKGGVTLGGDYRMASEGVFGKSISKLVPGIGPLMETYHKYLFQDFIPRLKMTMAQDALVRNRERYAYKLSEEQIVQKTANQANAAFGEQNYITLERSKTAQDLARLILLAPDFLESRARFSGQALEKGGKGGVLKGNEQRAALLLGAMTMYFTARAANYAISGQFHNEPENLFNVVYKGKAYGLRTIQGDILHLLSSPASFWLHRLNPIITRPALEAMTGRDEFGRKRDFMQQVWDDVSVIAPISLRSSNERGIYESLAQGMGITARRFNESDQAFKLAQDWKKKNEIQEKGEFIYDRDKDPLRPLKIALSKNDEGEAAAQIKKLVDSKQYDLSKLRMYFNRYSAMPFTGSHANDRKFIDSLSDDQKKTVQAAKQSKKDLRELYFKSEAQYEAALKQPASSPKNPVISPPASPSQSSDQ